MSNFFRFHSKWQRNLHVFFLQKFCDDESEDDMEDVKLDESSISSVALDSSNEPITPTAITTDIQTNPIQIVDSLKIIDIKLNDRYNEDNQGNKKVLNKMENNSRVFFTFFF